MEKTHKIYTWSGKPVDEVQYLGKYTSLRLRQSSENFEVMINHNDDLDKWTFIEFDKEAVKSLIIDLFNIWEKM